MARINKSLASLWRQDDYWHGAQRPGRCFSKDALEGYYNDLTKKVIPNEHLDLDSLIPKVSVRGVAHIHPVTVCQVGLGAYDLFLLTGESLYFEKAKVCADWLLDHAVRVPGAGTEWRVPYPFELFFLTKPFNSGLIQGQAISLLVRLYSQTGSVEYLDVARESFENLVIPVSSGGCKSAGIMAFEEYPSSVRTLVLNGNISAIWGVLDLAKATSERKYFETYKQAVNQLLDMLPQYMAGKWSRYSLRKNDFSYCNLASPYYHKEHIAQLGVMNELWPDERFRSAVSTWEQALESSVLRAYVIARKAIAVLGQKIKGLRH